MRAASDRLIGVHIVESALLGSLQLTFAMGDRTVSPMNPLCGLLLTPVT